MQRHEENTYVKYIVILLCCCATFACTHRVEVAAKEPITINLNVKIDHEIRVKVEKELDDLFSEDSDIF